MVEALTTPKALVAELSAAGLSQAEIAIEVGVSQAAISKLATNGTRRIRSSTYGPLVALAERVRAEGYRVPERTRPALSPQATALVRKIAEEVVRDVMHEVVGQRMHEVVGEALRELVREEVVATLTIVKVESSAAFADRRSDYN